MLQVSVRGGTRGPPTGSTVVRARKAFNPTAVHRSHGVFHSKYSKTSLYTRF